MGSPIIQREVAPPKKEKGEERKRKHVCRTLIYLSISFLIFQVRETSRGSLKSSKSSEEEGGEGDIPRGSTYSRFPGTA